MMNKTELEALLKAEYPYVKFERLGHATLRMVGRTVDVDFIGASEAKVGSKNFQIDSDADIIPVLEYFESREK